MSTKPVKNEFADAKPDGRDAEQVKADEAKAAADEKAAHEAKVAAQEAENEDAKAKQVTREEFLAYVKEELVPLADELGFDVVVKPKPDASKVFSGPTVRYDPDTLEGKTFYDAADVPVHFLTGDQVQALQEQRRAASAAE